MESVKLGDLEELVMLTVARLSPRAYGVNIKKELHLVAGRKVTLSTVHESLNRLQKKGYLVSEFGEATRTRGGKRKKYFMLTSSGSKILVEARKLREKMWRGIDALKVNPT